MQPELTPVNITDKETFPNSDRRNVFPRMNERQLAQDIEYATGWETASLFEIHQLHLPNEEVSR